MATGDRFYLMELRHRPALWGDIGHLLKIEGLVVGGEGAQAILMLPDTIFDLGSIGIHRLEAEDWTAWLQASDDPQVLVMPAKAFHRKLRYEISGAVQQKVWVADGCQCMYCRRPMGEVQLTIDHFIPLELGGVNDTSNYLSACRKCNRQKGSSIPDEWCQLKGLDFEFFVNYLTTRSIL